MLPEIGAVLMRGEDASQLPWTKGQRVPIGDGTELLLFPRHTLADGDLAEATKWAKRKQTAVAVLVPEGEEIAVPKTALPKNVSLISCPDTLEAIDRFIERRLLTSRVGRS